MALTALSFLGTGRYETTTYTWNGQSHTSRFVPAALREIFDPEALLVAETPEAREKHGTALADACEYDSIEVPRAAGESDWWEMFNAIAGAVPEGATLLVDVTHGFRSQPLLALAVLQYLRVVKGVTVERIVYGAYEAGGDEQSPIVDLTSFLRLMDWAEATGQFRRYGDAEPLRAMFREVAEERPSGIRPAAHLAPAGDTLETLTRALSLNRPLETLEEADGLIETLEGAMKDAMEVPSAEPLKRLMLLVTERFAPLGHAEGSVFTQRGFAAQAAMLRFYVDTDHYLQAFTLAQEMLVSWACVQQDLDPLARGTTGGDNKPKAGRRGGRTLLRTWADAQGTAELYELNGREQQVAEWWTNLRDQRNDVAHAGFSYNPTPAEELIDEAHTTLTAVADFFDPHS